MTRRAAQTSSVFERKPVGVIPLRSEIVKAVLAATADEIGLNRSYVFTMLY
jgi:hypothetical protein